LSIFKLNLENATLDVNKNISSARVRNLGRDHPSLYQELLTQTNKLPEQSTLLERLFCIFKNYSERPTCPCGNPVNFIRQNGGRYPTFCSTKCTFYREHIKEAVKQSCIKKFGSTSALGSKEVREKINATNISKYGSTSPMKSPEVVNNLKKAMCDKYGVDNISKLQKIKDKKKETCLKNYGVDNPSKDKGVRSKVVETNLNQFGTTWFSKTDQYKEKVRQTSLSRFGVEHSQQEHYNQDTLKLISNPVVFKEWLLQKHISEKLSGGEIAELLEVSHKTVWNYCDKFGIQLKRFSNSALQKDVLKHITEIYSASTVIECDRATLNGLEIDILLPEKNIGIEVNGLYWHSHSTPETTKEKLKHQDKTSVAAEKGIKLFTIFENEWDNEVKQSIWKSILSNSLNNTKRIFARKCEIAFPTSEEVLSFYSVNHIQGHVHSKVNLALKYEGNLVQLMSFSKSRYNKAYQWELTRLCSLSGVRVTGGASKLFKFFLNQHDPKSVISYCDLRYGTGAVYEKLGLSLSHIAAPNYYYFKPNQGILYTRMQFQKHKLASKLDIFDSKLSESQNMFNNGYYRIWDCGNKVFVYTKDKQI